MSDYISDPDLLGKLNQPQPAEKSEYVTDPALLEQLSTASSYSGSDSMPEGKEIGIKEAIQTALPAITPVAPTGMGALAREMTGAISPYAKSAVSAATAGYRARPLMTAAVDAIGLGTMGAPVASMANSAMGAADQYDRIKGVSNQVGKVLSNTPGNPVNYFAMGRAAPEAAAILNDLYHNKGGPNAIKAWLQTPEGAKYMKNPAFAQAAEQYMGKVPGLGAQAMKVVGPILRGAAKIAGPAGLALNAYDASEFAQQADLGGRLAQGQGRMAQQAFRNMNIKNSSPITPAEAAAVLQNGSPRDIEAMGGQRTLDALIRQKAASKVLGPVAPTGP